MKRKQPFRPPLAGFIAALAWLAEDDEPDADGDAMRAELEPDLVLSADPAKPLMRTEPWLN